MSRVQWACAVCNTCVASWVWGTVPAACHAGCPGLQGVSRASGCTEAAAEGAELGLKLHCLSPLHVGCTEEGSTQQPSVRSPQCIRRAAKAALSCVADRGFMLLCCYVSSVCFVFCACCSSGRIP